MRRNLSPQRHRDTEEKRGKEDVCAGRGVRVFPVVGSQRWRRTLRRRRARVGRWGTQNLRGSGRSGSVVICVAPYCGEDLQREGRELLFEAGENGNFLPFLCDPNLGRCGIFYLRRRPIFFVFLCVSPVTSIKPFVFGVYFPGKLLFDAACRSRLSRGDCRSRLSRGSRSPLSWHQLHAELGCFAL